MKKEKPLTIREFDQEKYLGITYDKPSKTERLGFVPMEKRISRLLSAGLLLRRVRDEYFDSFDDPDALEELPAPPPLSRHLDPDLAEVSDLAREYNARRIAISMRIASMDKENREKFEEKRRAALTAEHQKAAANIDQTLSGRKDVKTE